MLNGGTKLNMTEFSTYQVFDRKCFSCGKKFPKKEINIKDRKQIQYYNNEVVYCKFCKALDEYNIDGKKSSGLDAYGRKI